jgi:hypothetical protein
VHINHQDSGVNSIHVMLLADMSCHPGYAVNSPAFAAAVFDLYMGDQPVSGEARLTALSAAQRMMASGVSMHSVPATPFSMLCTNQ